MAAIFSCNKKQLIENSQNEFSVKQPISNSSLTLNAPYQQSDVVLGNQLTNPYLIRNMMAAKQYLVNQGLSSLNTVNIRATHYYVKFKPTNEDQYETLAADTNLTLYDYPLDYQITQNGNRYHDPSLPDSVPTYQYTSVKTDYIFNDIIRYEIIATLYIPEVDQALLGSSNENLDYVDKLLDEAYKETGNFDDTIVVNPTTPDRRFHPSGNIQIFDTRLGANIGMEGVDVRARRWFTSHWTRPDFNGNYYVDQTYTRPCNYSLWFSTSGFSVREHLFHLTAWINGPKQTGAWNYTINDGYDRFAGHVFRGAYRYHYKDIGDLRRPLIVRGNRNTYVASNSYGNASGNNPFIFQKIKIWRYKTVNDVEYASDEIFSTTCHETAHSMHAMAMNSILQFIQVSTQIRESWAIAVEWWLTKLEYQRVRGISNYGEHDYSVSVEYPNQYAYQYWNSNIQEDYTSLFINIIDDYNEFRQGFGFYTGTVNDNVRGFTLGDIEANMLNHIYGLPSLGDELINHNLTATSDTEIGALLKYY